LTIAVIAAALLAAVWDRHGAGIAAQETPASVASHSEMVGPGNGNAKDILARDNGAPTSDSLPFKPDQPVKDRISEAFGKLPLSFEANGGQVDRQVKFISRGQGYNLFLTSNEAVLSLSKSAKQSRQRVAAASGKTTKFHPARERAVVRMKLVGGNPAAQVQGLDELPAKTNYFIGADPSKWRSVSNYAKVEYKNVYPGIDLVYYGNQRQLEYDFVVAPGADPGAIKLAFAGTRGLRIDGNGELVLRTAGGELRQRKPIIYQEVDGARKSVEGRYALKGRREAGFEIGDYDPSRPLVIDPVLVYSTFLGGGASGDGHGIAADSAGNAYVTGWTPSANFPVKNAYQDFYQGGHDVFVTKLNTNVSGVPSLMYSTFLGGGGEDAGFAIAVDSSGNAYVTGNTASSNFPTLNALQASFSHPSPPLRTDAFVTKLNTNVAGPASLLYSTYLGGSDTFFGFFGDEEGRGIAVDSSGFAYVTGRTQSSNFPMKNAYQSTPDGNLQNMVFVTKLNTNAAGAASLLYSTYLRNNAVGKAIAADSSGNAYVTGSTLSSAFPLLNAVQTSIFAQNAFVTRINTNASGVASLVYSTFLGSGTPNSPLAITDGAGIAADSAGVVYVTGTTSANDFPTKNAFQTFQAAADAFVAKINTNASGAASLLYSTFLGGGNDDYANGIAADASGAAYVTGLTYSNNFPLKDAYQAVQGNGDVFVTKLNTNTSGSAALLFSTYLGGIRLDLGRAIAADSAGNAYVTGFTDSANFPTINSIPGGLNIRQVFVAKLNTVVNLPPIAMCQNVTVSAGPSCAASASINNGSSDPDGNPITITQSPPGPYPLGTTSVTMTVTDSNGASSSCSATVTVTDNTPPTITAPPAVNVSTGPSATGCGMVISDAALGAATASDNCGGATITRSSLPAGNFFPVGTTYITYTADDGRGNTATALQAVTVTDTTPPAPDLATLPDITGQCSATISAAPTATDYCRGSVTGTTTDPLTYPSQGTFTVTWTFNDGNGNTSAQTQRVVVRDTAAPVITTANKTVNTDPNLCSAVVAHGTTASDNCAPASLVGVRSDNAALTAPYPKGTTTINWTATDQAGNASTATQTITVIDNIPPVITACATGKTVPANASCQAVVPSLTGEVSATDNCTTSSALTITQTPAAGTLLGLGATQVTITVKDAAGNLSICAVTVNVVDATSPTVASSVTEASLWPPNHDLINVGLAVSLTDNCTPNSTVQVLVYSDEDDEEETGDGNHSPDAKDLAPGSLRLRSERKGDGDGRVYLIVVKVTDAAGNVGFACSTVVVPKSQSQANKDAVNAQAAAAKAYFQANGAPPSGYFVVGDGPVIGPKQ
jgi:hypothetical protein